MIYFIGDIINNSVYSTHIHNGLIVNNDGRYPCIDMAVWLHACYIKKGIKRYDAAAVFNDIEIHGSFDYKWSQYALISYLPNYENLKIPVTFTEDPVKVKEERGIHIRHLVDYIHKKKLCNSALTTCDGKNTVGYDCPLCKIQKEDRESTGLTDTPLIEPDCSICSALRLASLSSVSFIINEIAIDRSVINFCTACGKKL